MRVGVMSGERSASTDRVMAGIRVVSVRNVSIGDSERRLSRVITMLLGEAVALCWSLPISSEAVIVTEAVVLELIPADVG